MVGYMTGWMVVELCPVLGWSKFQVILACGVLVLVYTVVSGLLGVAYNQVLQFSVFLLGAVLLLPNMIGHFGGWSNMVTAAVANRGPEFMSALPPSPSLAPLILFALVIQGFFFAANPTAGEGATAQKFMAARDETHAALGQMLSAFLSLVVRVVPFVIFAIAAAGLFEKDAMAPELIWSQLVLKFAPTGLLGLVIAAELAGYMAISNAYMNWGGSFITNDIYKRLIKPEASGRELALVGKMATTIIVSLSFFIAFFLVDRMMSWFLYINAVMIAFFLPLAWLRFFWWRLNIWGEAAGVLLGLPLGYLIWFHLGFSDRPFWQAFFVLFATGWLAILLATWLTPAEKPETLRRFYQRCRPPGFWGPVAQVFPVALQSQIRREFAYSLWTGAVGVLTCGAMVVALNGLIGGSVRLAMPAGALMIAAGILFVQRWRSTPEVQAVVGAATIAPEESAFAAGSGEERGRAVQDGGLRS